MSFILILKLKIHRLKDFPIFLDWSAAWDDCCGIKNTVAIDRIAIEITMVDTDITLTCLLFL